MPGANRPLEVDVRCRQLGSQIQTCAALDSVHAQAVLLQELARYLAAGEIKIVQTAWDPAHPEPTNTFHGAPMFSRLASRCAVCTGEIKVGTPILYNSELRRAAHESCGRAVKR